MTCYLWEVQLKKKEHTSPTALAQLTLFGSANDPEGKQFGASSALIYKDVCYPNT